MSASTNGFWNERESSKSNIFSIKVNGFRECILGFANCKSSSSSSCGTTMHAWKFNKGRVSIYRVNRDK